MSDNKENGQLKPAYASWRTFYNFLGKLKATIVPPKMDSSVMKGMSGSAQSQMRTSLRWLDLIRDDDSTTDKLEKLVAAHGTDDWRDTLTQVVFDAYNGLVGDLDLDSGTAQQLAARFREYGLAGETLAKAVRFYLHALESTGVSYSPLFAAPSVERKRSRKRKAASENENDSETGGDADDEKPPPQPPRNPSQGKPVAEAVLAKIPAFDGTWDAEVQKKWFDALQKVVGMIEDK